VYGHGIYFAMHQAFETSRKYALPAPDGHRHILLCQIYARKVEPLTDYMNTQFQGKDPRAEAATGKGIIVVWGARVNLVVLPKYIVSVT